MPRSRTVRAFAIRNGTSTYLLTFKARLVKKLKPLDGQKTQAFANRWRAMGGGLRLDGSEVWLSI